MGTRFLFFNQHERQCISDRFAIWFTRRTAELPSNPQQHTTSVDSCGIGTTLLGPILNPDATTANTTGQWMSGVS